MDIDTTSTTTTTTTTTTNNNNSNKKRKYNNNGTIKLKTTNGTDVWIERTEANSPIIDFNLRAQSTVEINFSLHFLFKVHATYWKHYYYNPVIMHQPNFFITNIVANLQDKIKNNTGRNKVPAIYYMFPGIDNLYHGTSLHHASICHIDNEGRKLLNILDNNVHQFWNVNRQTVPGRIKQILGQENAIQRVFNENILEGSTSFSSINVHHVGGALTMIRAIMIYPFSKKLTSEGTPLHCPTSACMNNTMADEKIYSSEIYLMIVSSRYDH